MTSRKITTDRLWMECDACEELTSCEDLEYTDHPAADWICPQCATLCEETFDVLADVLVSIITTRSES